MAPPNETHTAVESPSPPMLVERSKEPNRSANAGRGGLALAGGKVFFLVTGLVQQIALKAVLGLGAYGALSTAQSVASIAYNPLIQSGIQGVSRQIAGADDVSAPLIHRRLLKVHSIGAIASSLVFLACAGPLATWLGAPHVAPGIRLLSIILLIYGLYAPLVGYINGRRLFVHQASLDILSASLRTVGLVAGAYIATRWFTGTTGIETTSLQVQGAVLGFCVAAALWVLVSARVAGLGRSGGHTPPLPSYLRIVLPILGGQILLNLLFQADALLLRRFASDAATSMGLLPDAADRFVGAYRASQLFCFLPFQLLTSLTFVLFPLLASARAQGDADFISQLIERGLRLALLLAGLIISALVAVPEGLLLIVFGNEAAELGGSSMRILAGGMGFFALLGVITSAMNSLGAEKQSFKLFAVAVALVAALCFWLTREDNLSPQLLNHIAMATSLAMVATTVTAAFLLGKLTGARLSLRSLGRTVAAVIVVGVSLPRFFSVEQDCSKVAALLPTLLGACCALVLFLLLLILTGELKKTDWEQLKKLFLKG